MIISLSTDHAGYEAVGKLKAFVESLGHEAVYHGPDHFDLDDDYPAFMFASARAVASGDCQMGVILGGSGQGEAMAANRIKGVRCAVFYGTALAKTAVDAEGNQSDDPYEIIKLSRQHNDANMLSLSGRFLSDEEMHTAIELWLNTPFSGAVRHQRRINQLDEV